MQRPGLTTTPTEHSLILAVIDSMNSMTESLIGLKQTLIQAAEAAAKSKAA